jgi:hypothetical protein
LINKFYPECLNGIANRISIRIALLCASGGAQGDQAINRGCDEVAC